MAPRFILNQNHVKINKHRDVIKYKRKNVQLRKSINLLLMQNKQLSATRNNLLQQNMELQNKNSSLNNLNTQLIAINHTLRGKLNVFDQTLQECVPALVTLSQKIPSMIDNVHQISKFSESSIFCNTQKKERQTKVVKPVINGLNINQPVISEHQYNMSPIIESPHSEQTPRQSTKFSTSNSSHRKLDMESFVRMKDVAALLKNSKAVSNENSPNQQTEHLDEEPYWLHSQKNQCQNSHNNLFLDETCSPIKHNLSSLNAVVTDMSTSTSNDTIYTTHNEYQCESESPNKSGSMLKNITLRKPSKRRSSETTLDIDTSTSFTRSKRSRAKPVNYKEKSIRDKLRREN
ncbi:Shugoshin, C-terminal [Cinara cedri]|uniref:Shugoshin, C-terminal n=1 Tax=Cinara cedri TaxID=506608 RepID=A0A5E4MQE2_9HEMI|nr:Shugoshin, C-terminal [Cinara cedri]